MYFILWRYNNMALFDPKSGKYVFRLPSEHIFVNQEDEKESITLD